MAAINSPLATVATSDELIRTAAGPRGQQPGRSASARRRLNAFRYIVFAAFGFFFLVPLLATLRFSLYLPTVNKGWSISAWTSIPSYVVPGGDPLLSTVEITLEIAAATAALILLIVLPTMIWVHLRVRSLRRVMEVLCLLPLMIPAIVTVVGLAPVYNKIEQYNVSALMLFWADGILALPYVYRALTAGLNAMDAKTLSEAARSLGARWPTVMFRVIAPNMAQAILNALLLTVSLALGEFTIAYLLNYTNLSVELFAISRNTNNASVLFAGSLALLLFAFLLLLVMSYVGRRLQRGRATR